MKCWQIVTNDAAELPVGKPVYSLSEAAKVIGVCKGTLGSRLHRDRWKGKYKLIRADDGKPEKSAELKRKEYYMTHPVPDRREYFRERYRRKKMEKQAIS